jgi:hypothetical protein
MSTIKINSQSVNEQKTATKTVPINSGSDAPARERSSPSSNRHSNQGIASARGGGPKTRHGKKRSSRNSLKHGIFSSVVLLEDEPAAQFDLLLQGFRNDFQPEGVVEETLVEQLATSKWRYRRMLAAERAEIQVEGRYNSQTDIRNKRDREEARSFELSVEAQVIEDEQNGVTMPRPGLVARLNNPVIRERCIEILKSLHEAIKVRDFSPCRDKQDIAKIYGQYGQGHFQLRYALCSSPGEFAECERVKEFDLPPAERRRKFLEYLQGVIDGFEDTNEVLKLFSENRKAMERKCCVVPEAPRLDRLLRYSASLERDFDRTLNQLERHQRNRRGQPMPPTLNVNVSA